MSSLRKALCWELHVSRFSFFHHDWKVFYYTPWLPQRFAFQWIYLVYKWLLTVFFGFYTIFSFTSSVGYFFIYMTNWGVFFLTLYFLVNSIIITGHYIRLHCRPSEYEIRKEECFDFSELPKKPTGWCGLAYNTLRWYNCIQWLLFTISSELAVAITVLYWAFLHATVIDHWDVTLHLLNGVMAFLEVWITRLPVRIYHVVYVMLFSSVYVLFTGIYYVSGGINDYSNTTYIYSVLDYENAPASAAAFASINVLMLTSVIHLFFYANYLLREGTLHFIARKCKWIESH